MTLPTESITQAGSGLVFINAYDANVSQAYRSAIIAAENQLQQHFTNQLTLNVEFDLSSLGAGTAAQNEYSAIDVSFAQFTAALRAHATSASGLLAVGGLPASDPSNGASFQVPISYAAMLGLRPATNELAVKVTLNSDLGWSFGQDAISAIQHEITEGGFGRVASLGVASTEWAPLDLFRFTASGVRDYTGGKDGVTTYFGLDSGHVSGLVFHNAVNTAGVFDGQDFGDWNNVGDAFGPGGPAAPGVLSSTDLQVLNALGWNSAPFTPAADDYASSLTDSTHPFGQLGVGGAVTGALQQAGDRDWFKVSLQQGATYEFDLKGGGSLPDAYLRLHDASGALIASNDDVSAGNPDSRIVFTATSTGVYYAEAGGFADGYAGHYTLSLSQTAASASPLNTASDVGEVLQGSNPAGDTITGLAGPDTITGGAGSNVLQGGDGGDSISGGAGFNNINGNKGDDTIVGSSQVGDWLSGGQGNDVISVHASSHNLVFGNIGNDTISAGSGGDTLRGGQGDDSIVGGAGADWLSGDRGHDTLTGGGGADTFHSAPGMGVSVVTDFSQTQHDHVLLDSGASQATTTVSQSGANVLIDLGGGTQVILQNVQLTSLSNGWLVYG